MRGSKPESPQQHKETPATLYGRQGQFLMQGCREISEVRPILQEQWIEQ